MRFRNVALFKIEIHSGNYFRDKHRRISLSTDVVCFQLYALMNKLTHNGIEWQERKDLVQVFLDMAGRITVWNTNTFSGKNEGDFKKVFVY